MEPDDVHFHQIHEKPISTPEEHKPSRDSVLVTEQERRNWVNQDVESKIQLQTKAIKSIYGLWGVPDHLMFRKEPKSTLLSRGQLGIADFKGRLLQDFPIFGRVAGPKYSHCATEDPYEEKYRDLDELTEPVSWYEPVIAVAKVEDSGSPIVVVANEDTGEVEAFKLPPEITTDDPI